MRTKMVVVLGALALVAIAVIAAAWFFFKRPMTVYTWQSRFALRGAGLKKRAVDSPAGTQVVFRGGAGPVLVLLHGAGDQAGTWFKVAPELARRFTIVAPDLAGHGESDPPRGPLGLSTILAGVEADIAHESPSEPVTIVGNSLGAWIGTLYAHRHPDRVARLVLVNGGALLGERPDLSLVPADREAARRLIGELRDPGSPPVPDFILDDTVRIARTSPLARLAAGAPEIGPFLMDGKLGEVKVPVELVWGESDRLLSMGYAHKMMAALPSARLTRIPRCGHVPHIECPDRFLAALRAALEGKR